jgi:hypothetical protein
MMLRRYTIATVALVAPLLAAACGGHRVRTAPVPAQLQALHASLAAYSSLALARKGGYATQITDCMSNGDEGAMGLHFGNPTLIDGVPDALHPEVLIYEPGHNGEMSLVGVEFVVPFDVVPKTGRAPELFGQKYSPNDVFGLWALHVWTHRTNPSGTFASWNPRVHC